MALSNHDAATCEAESLFSLGRWGAVSPAPSPPRFATPRPQHATASLPFAPPGAAYARAHHRRVVGPPGPARVSPHAADPRAAYPPRQGHLQRVHRPGAGGGGRGEVVVGFLDVS